MAKYLTSFPSAATVVPAGEWEVVVRDAHAVNDEAKAASGRSAWRSTRSTFRFRS
jgi:hypothetical protein